MIRGLSLIIIVSVFFVFFITSCAIKHAEMPSFAGVDLHDYLKSLSNVSDIEAVLSMEYEKQHNLMQGDASLLISENHIDLKIYYLGFLAGYIKENNGIITASQKIDKNKTHIIVDGLKSSFLWWKINDYIIDDEGEFYKIKTYNKKILVDKKTLLPTKQTIELANGEELKILYSSPAKVEQDSMVNEGITSPSSWYQSNMRIELNNHSLNIKIKSYNLILK